MAHPLETLIDQIVAKAAREGEFDDLPGAGKPLPAVDDPKNAVMSRMMKEAGAKPEVVTLRERIGAVQSRLKELPAGEARTDAMAELADLQMRLSLEMEAMRRYS